MNEIFDDKRKAIIAKYTSLTPEELNVGFFDLVFVCGEKIGFLEENNLVDYAGNSVNISDNEKVIIAHPYAIYKDGHWSEYQKYLFDNQLV